jgi:hypothetical protein
MYLNLNYVFGLCRYLYYGFCIINNINIKIIIINFGRFGQNRHEIIFAMLYSGWFNRQELIPDGFHLIL